MSRPPHGLVLTLTRGWMAPVSSVGAQPSSASLHWTLPTLSGRLGAAYRTRPWVQVRWSREQLCVWDEFRLSVGGWVISWGTSGVSARRPAPVSTQAWIVIRVSGRPPAACPPDWWLLQPQGDLLLRRLEPPDFELVLPLTEAERSTLIRRMRRSRPGPSQTVWRVSSPRRLRGRSPSVWLSVAG